MKSEFPMPVAIGAVVVLLIGIVGAFVWVTSPHPRAPKPGETIRAPKMPGGGPRMAPPPAAQR